MLRTQAIFGAMLVTLLLLGSVLGVSELVLMPGYRELETQQAMENRDRARGGLMEFENSLSDLLYTWSSWDDFYAFIDDDNEEFREANFVVENFNSLNIRYIATFDRDCEIVFAATVHEGAKAFSPFPKGFQKLLMPHCSFFKTLKGKGIDHQLSGLVRYNNENIALAWRPILHTNDKGPPNGSVLFARPFGDKEQQALNERSRLKIKLYPLGAKQSPAELRSLESKEVLKETPPVFEERGSNSLAVWSLLPGFDQKPAMYQEVVMARDLMAAGKATTFKFLVALSLVSLFIIVGVFLALEVKVLRRLKALVLHLANMQKNGVDLSRKAPVQGSDELDAVARGLNSLADHLKELVQGVDRQAQEVQLLSVHTAELVTEATQNQGMGVKTVEALMAGILEQVQAGERAAISMEDMAEKGRQATSFSREVSVKSAEVQDLVGRGTREVLEVVGRVRAIHGLGTQSLERVSELEHLVKTIGDFVAIISRLSEQTNLVALNAAIEAARASAEGQGFTVVATEVRKLAEESAIASMSITRNIRQMEESMRQAAKAVDHQAQEVEGAVSSVGQAETVFKAINERVMGMVDGLGAITRAMAESEAEAKVVLEAVTGAAALSEEAGAGSSEIHEQEVLQQKSLAEIAEQCGYLQELAKEMKQSVERFRVG